MEIESTARSYDHLASEYANRIGDELRGKPFDRAMLRMLAGETSGLICDLGCGPGHVAGFLREAGATVVGVDLSVGMVEVAKHLHPGIEFRTGNMLSLPFPDETFSAIVAFYSIIHLPADSLGAAFREMRRVTKPGGFLLASFHIGDEVRHFDELWGCEVNLDFRFFEPEFVQEELLKSGWKLLSSTRRAPSEGVEAPTERGYLHAQKSTNQSAADAASA